MYPIRASDILPDQKLHPYHPPKDHEINPGDVFGHIIFCAGFTHNCIGILEFVRRAIFRDEAHFCKQAVFGCRNIWGDGSPYAIHPYEFQQQFDIDIWTCILVFGLSRTFYRTA